ncbi:MAG: phosphoribosyltransferase family protein [Flavobacteriales bacterium]
MSNRTIVLTHDQIQQKIRRIAHEIYEHNYQEEKIILIGIAEQGYTLAERLHQLMKEVNGDLKIELGKLTMNKENPLNGSINLSIHPQELNNQTLVLVDDVLNSGKTLIYAAQYLLQSPLKKMNTVCLVDRRHRRFPIRADFVGLTLSTTIQEHIEVEFKSGSDTVYLV